MKFLVIRRGRTEDGRLKKSTALVLFLFHGAFIMMRAAEARAKHELNDLVYFVFHRNKKFLYGRFFSIR